jgi:hypothetical protein
MVSDLAGRLRKHGLPRTTRVTLHANRSVLVTVTARGSLRVHAGFAAAPDPVLAAIVRWARPGIRRRDRLEAQRLLTGFPVHEHVARRAPRRPRPQPIDPADHLILQRLTDLHRALNEAHFRPVLGTVTLRLSDRMRRRLGEFRPAEAGQSPEIAISRRHLRRDGWAGVRETLLHEMVHQWQAETGRPLGHGADFRHRCAELGIEGRAVVHPARPPCGYLLRSSAAFSPRA